MNLEKVQLSQSSVGFARREDLWAPQTELDGEDP